MIKKGPTSKKTNTSKRPKENHKLRGKEEGDKNKKTDGGWSKEGGNR